MAKVRYKKPSVDMERMVVKEDKDSRLSLGMTEVKGEIYYLSPDIILPYKNQARKDIKEESLAELATSIQSQGIIQPLQVIASLENKGKFEVISGERRLRAARIVGLPTVPCMILDQSRDAEEIALIENIQREDLHIIELADAIAKLLDGTKHGSQTEIAQRLGVQKSQISHLLVISKLPEDVKLHLLEKKNIKIDFLRKVAYLKDEEEIRKKIFGAQHSQKVFKSILRLSFNGETFKIDQLKVDKFTSDERNLLKEELSRLIQKITP